MENHSVVLPLQSLSLAPVIDRLKDGKQLTNEQLEGLKRLLDIERNNQELKAIIDLFPLLFLQSIDSTLQSINERSQTGEKQEKFDSGEERNLHQLAIILCRLVDSSNYESITKVCVSQLGLTPSIYLYMYTNLAMRYYESIYEPIKMLLPLLESSEKDVVMSVTLVLYFFVKKDPSSEKQISEAMQKVLNEQTTAVGKQEFAFLFTSFEIFLPLIPGSLLPLYCSDACKNLFLYRGLILNPDTYSEDIEIAEKLLKVISVSCMYEEARKFNSANYTQFLISGTKVESSTSVISLSCLCIVKIWDFSALEKKILVQSILAEVTEQLKKITDYKDPSLDPLIEAMTYLSLSATLRTTIRSDRKLIYLLLSILNESETAVIRYGTLTTFSNLTKISAPESNSDNQTRKYLMSVAEAQQLNHTGEDEESISKFNKEMVTVDLISKVSKSSASNDRCAHLAVKIIYYASLKQGSDVLRKIAEQGAPDFLLKYVLEHSTLDKDSGKIKSSSEGQSVQENRVFAIKAFAALCRSVDPEKLLLRYKPHMAVPFLVEMLDQVSESGVFESLDAVQFDALDLLFGLLALTNLCALPDDNLHRLVVQRTFEAYLKNLIFDNSRPEIQKAAWELANNLMGCPFMLAKFFNPDSPSSKKNLKLLVKHLNAENLPLQEILAGLLANATSDYTLVTDSILADQNLFKELTTILTQILNEQSHEQGLIYRLGMFLHNMCNSQRALSLLRQDEIKQGLVKVIQGSSDNDIRLLYAEIVKQVFS